MQAWFTILKSILLPLIGGTVALWYAVATLRKQLYLRRHGIKTEGIIFDFFNEEYVSYGLEDKYLPYPIIRFVTEEGEWITEQYKKAAHTGMKQGDKIQVWYSPEDPRQFYIYTWHWDTVLLLATTLASIAAIGLGMYKLVEYLIS